MSEVVETSRRSAFEARSDSNALEERLVYRPKSVTPVRAYGEMIVGKDLLEI